MPSIEPRQRPMGNTDPCGIGFPRSPFANMTPTGALTKAHFNIKSRIQPGTVRMSSGAFCHSNNEFAAQKKDLDDVYASYKKLYDTENQKQAADRKSEVRRQDNESDVKRQHRRHQHEENLAALREQMDEREADRVEENIKKLAGEMKVNKYVAENKTLVNIFPEMHAVPEYVEKEWTREQNKQFGSKLNAVIGQKSRAKKLEQKMAKQEYNAAMDEQAVQDDINAKRFHDAYEKRNVKTLNDWDMQKRVKEFGNHVQDKTDKLTSAIVRADLTAADATLTGEGGKPIKQEFDISSPQAKPQTARQFYKSVNNSVTKAGQPTGNYNILWGSSSLHKPELTTNQRHFQDPKVVRQNQADKIPNQEATLHKHYYRPGYEEGFLPDPEFDEADVRSEAAIDGDIQNMMQDINLNEDVANQRESLYEDFSENGDQVDDLGEYQETFDDKTSQFASEAKSKRSNATTTRTSNSKRIGSARRLRPAFMAEADMFETKSKASKQSRTSRAGESNLNNLTKKALELKNDQLLASMEDPFSVRSPAEDELKSQVRSTASGGVSERRSVFSAAVSRRSQAPSSSVNSSYVLKRITAARTNGFPEFEQNEVVENRIQGAQMKVQLDALKRVMDSYEKSALDQKRIAQTERWQNKKSDLLKKLDKECKNNQEKITQKQITDQWAEKNMTMQDLKTREREIPDIAGDEGYPRVAQLSGEEVVKQDRYRKQDHARTLIDQMNEKKRLNQLQKDCQKQDFSKTLQEWQAAPTKGYVQASAGTLGYPNRIAAQMKHQDDLKQTKEIWQKTKRILDIKSKMQQDLKVIVNEDTLIPTLRETEQQLTLLHQRHQQRNDQLNYEKSMQKTQQSAGTFSPLSTLSPRAFDQKRMSQAGSRERNQTGSMPSNILMHQKPAKDDVFTENSYTAASSRRSVANIDEVRSVNSKYNTIQPKNVTGSQTPSVAKRNDFDYMERLSKKIQEKSQVGEPTKSFISNASTIKSTKAGAGRCPNLSQLEQQKAGGEETVQVKQKQINEEMISARQRAYPWETRENSCNQIERLLDFEKKKRERKNTGR